MIYKRIFVCGSITYDEIMDFPGKFVDYFDPSNLHQINVSFAVSKLERQLGGTATNIAYNLRLMLNLPITVVSAVGKDGRDFIDFFTHQKIDGSYLSIANNSYSATGKVITDTANNQIWGYFYGPLGKTKSLKLTSTDSKTTVGVVSATAKEAFLKAQSDMIRIGLPYLYDPGMTLTWISQKDLEKGIMNCRWLVGNDYEITQIVKKIGVTKRDIITSGGAIITTQGAAGAIYESRHERLVIPAFRLTTIVDPTGAGDAFRGGFLAGIISGRTVEEALLQANALASFAVEQYGTVNHKPTKKEITTRMNKIKSMIK